MISVPAMISKLIQAPSPNFATRMISVVTPVASMRTAFISSARSACASSRRRRHQWATMPACDMVNARKAPIANSGMSESVMP